MNRCNVEFKDYARSNTSIGMTLIMLLPIAEGVAGILYAWVNPSTSEQALGAWFESVTGTTAWAAAIVWVTMIWRLVKRSVGL